MRNRPAKIKLVVASVATCVGAAFALAAPGWACFPQAHSVTLKPQGSGPPGSQVTVEGTAFDPAPSTVEVRWNSVDGPLLATPDGPDFSVSVTVPQVDNGVYTVLAFSRGSAGGIGNSGAATFEVTGGTGGGAASSVRTAASVPARAASKSSGKGTGALEIGLLFAGGVVVGVLAALAIGSARRRRSREVPVET